MSSSPGLGSVGSLKYRAHNRSRRKNLALHRGKIRALTPARSVPNLRKSLETAMFLLARVEEGDITPEVTRPDPSKLISGDPEHTTWNVEERGAHYCGVWQSTPGKWWVSFGEWEYVYIHVGHSILTDAAGHETHLMATDSFIIRPGFEGTWDVVETTIKDYVIVG